MSAVLLIVAGVAVVFVTTLLLRASGAGRELFGRDAWMLKSRPDNDSSDDIEGSFIEHHEFWGDTDFERDFWDEVPGEQSDDPDLDVAAGE